MYSYKKRVSFSEIGKDGIVPYMEYCIIYKIVAHFSQRI